VYILQYSYLAGPGFELWLHLSTLTQQFSNNQSSKTYSKFSQMQKNLASVKHVYSIVLTLQSN